MTGKWSKKEHQKFLEGLRLFGKDWTKIQAYVETREYSNLLSHGQKFLSKLVNLLEYGQMNQSFMIQEL